MIKKTDAINFTMYEGHDGTVHIVLSGVNIKWIDFDELKIIIKNHINRHRKQKVFKKILLSGMPDNKMLELAHDEK